MINECLNWKHIQIETVIKLLKTYNDESFFKFENNLIIPVKKQRNIFGKSGVGVSVITKKPGHSVSKTVTRFPVADFLVKLEEREWFHGGKYTSLTVMDPYNQRNRIHFTGSENMRYLIQNNILHIAFNGDWHYQQIGITKDYSVPNYKAPRYTVVEKYLISRNEVGDLIKTEVSKQDVTVNLDESLFLPVKDQDNVLKILKANQDKYLSKIR